MEKESSHIKRYEIILIIVAILLAAFFYYQFGASSIDSKVSESVYNFKQNNFEEAIQASDEILSKDANNISALLIKSATLAQQGSLTFEEEKYGTQAVGVVDQILAIDSENSEAWRIKGYAYESMQDYSQAFDAYNKAISFDQNNSLAFSSRGHAYFLTGDYQRAKADYLKALDINPNLTHALINLSRILIIEEKYTEAKNNLTKALSLEDNLRFKAETKQLMATISLVQQDFLSAKLHFEDSLGFDDTLASSWVGLANAKFLTLSSGGLSVEKFNQQVSSIFSDLERATQINPNQTSAYILTGRLLGVLESSQAINAFNKALEVLEKDITLGAIEKELVREVIEKDIAFINN